MTTLYVIHNYREYRFEGCDPWDCGWDWDGYDADEIGDQINVWLQDLAERMLSARAGPAEPGELVDDDLIDEIQRAVTALCDDLLEEWCEGDNSHIEWENYRTEESDTDDED